MKELIERLGLFLSGVATISLFRVYGRLPFEAALLIGGAFTLVAVWLYGLRQLADFKSYRLIIGINYEGLWEDFKLAPADTATFENYSFTAISAVLFARSDERQYSTALDLYKAIPCAKPTWAGGPGEVMNGPTFFFRPWRNGYQLGVRVQEEWWQWQGPQLKPALRDLPLAHDSTLILGTLPAGYMPEHIWRWHEPIALWYGFDRRQRRWKAKLAALGWTLDDDYPDHITHRYLESASIPYEQAASMNAASAAVSSGTSRPCC